MYYVLRRLPLACERLLAKRKSEDHGLRDFSFSKHKRSCILFDWNNLFSRHRRARIKFDSSVIKLTLCLTELNVVLVSIHFKHQTGASWPGLVMIEPAMLSCFTVRTNSLQSPTVSTSSTRDFIGCSPLSYPGYVALSKKESNRERRSVTMVRSSRIFRTNCRYITDATENAAKPWSGAHYFHDR